MMTKTLSAAILALGGLAAMPTNAAPIAYHGLVATDVTVNGTAYHNAVVRIDLLSDTSKVQAATGGVPGWSNSYGYATVRIDTGSGTIVARLASHQIAASISFPTVAFVIDTTETPLDPSYNPVNKPTVIAGFTAGTGGGYALLISEAGGTSGGDSTIGALADVRINPADESNYLVRIGGQTTTIAAAIGADLKSPTNLTGAALACSIAPQALVSVQNDGTTPDYSTFGCTSSAPVTLSSNLGPIQIFAPYVDNTDGSLPPYSLNWGVFWAEMPPSDD